MRTDELGAIKSGPGFVADTLAINAAAASQTVVEAIRLCTIVSGEAFIANAHSVNATAVLTAVNRTGLHAAVFTHEAIETLALSVNAAALVAAVSGAVGYGAVGALPSGLADAAAGVRAVVSMTAAVGLRSYSTCGLSAAAGGFCGALLSECRQLALQHLQTIQELLQVRQSLRTATRLLGDVDAVGEDDLITAVQCVVCYF